MDTQVNLCVYMYLGALAPWVRSRVSTFAPWSVSDAPACLMFVCVLWWHAKMPAHSHTCMLVSPTICEEAIWACMRIYIHEYAYLHACEYDSLLGNTWSFQSMHMHSIFSYMCITHSAWSLAFFSLKVSAAVAQQPRECTHSRISTLDPWCVCKCSCMPGVCLCVLVNNRKRRITRMHACASCVLAYVSMSKGKQSMQPCTDSCAHVSYSFTNRWLHLVEQRMEWIHSFMLRCSYAMT